MRTIAVGLVNGCGKVEVDGVAISHIRKTTLVMEPGKPAVLALEALFDVVKLGGDGVDVRTVTFCPGCEGRIAKTGGFIMTPLAQVAYEAYADHRPLQADQTSIASLPAWDDLPDDEQLPWEHVARAIKLHGR